MSEPDCTVPKVFNCKSLLSGKKINNRLSALKYSLIVTKQKERSSKELSRMSINTMINQIF